MCWTRSRTDGLAELDPVVIGAAFGLIWLTGTLDQRGKDMASAAVLRQAARYGSQSTLEVLSRDLARFRARDRPQ